MPYTSHVWTVIILILAVFGGNICYTRGSSLSTILGLCTFCKNKDTHSPYHASWNTWFHPFQYVSSKPETIGRDEWKLFHHLGGTGPWVEKVDDTEQSGLSPPEGCSVDQVHLMSRHAARYPTESAGKRHLSLLNQIRRTDVALNGSLSFLNNWTYFTNNPSKDFGQLTTTGPYAGTLDAFTTGVRFRTRYEHLLPTNSKTRFWASDSRRVIQTAQYFASGLFGLDWEKDSAELQIIPETFERRADTLTPGDTCPRYLDDTELGYDNGYRMLDLFQKAYTPVIADRLIEGNPAIGKLTHLEIFSMQEMCGFETTSRGSSPWCYIFTQEDWENFEYARDLLHYYRAGPGNPYTGAMGWLWLNATANLLRLGPDAGTMFFSFVHDGDIAPFLTALGILKDPKYDPNLPSTHNAKDRVWRTSSIMPMGARITLERMTCSSKTSNRDRYVRININDKIVSLPDCQSGPGLSCSLPQFVEYAQRRQVEVGDFADVCGFEEDPGYITFLSQNQLLSEDITIGLKSCVS